MKKSVYNMNVMRVLNMAHMGWVRFDFPKTRQDEKHDNLV